MNENFGCAVIVLNSDSQVLIGKRKNSYKAGFYGIPGGRVVGQEKLIDAAKRELWEETGLTTIKLTYVGVVREWQDGYSFIHFVFFCQKWKGNVILKEPDKCEEWIWAKLDGLPKPVLTGHRTALKMYREELVVCDL